MNFLRGEGGVCIEMLVLLGFTGPNFLSLLFMLLNGFRNPIYFVTRFIAQSAGAVEYTNCFSAEG